METSQNKNNHKHFSLGSFVAGLLIALVLFFAIYKFFPKQASVEKSSLQKDSTQTTQKVNLSQNINFSDEHFYKDHHHSHIDKDAEAIIVSPNEMTALEKGNISDQQKKLLELLPNAPVIYILDFKVTDYQNFYFNMGEPRILENKLLAGQVLHNALKDFSEKNFEGCFDKMNLLYEANPDDVNALFYSGVSAFYKKDYATADNRLQKVISFTNNTFRQEAYWVRAMALYDNNKKDEARKLLKEIVDSKGFYTEKAAEKLKQMN